MTGIEKEVVTSKFNKPVNCHESNTWYPSTYKCLSLLRWGKDLQVTNLRNANKFSTCSIEGRPPVHNVVTKIPISLFPLTK